MDHHTTTTTIPSSTKPSSSSASVPPPPDRALLAAIESAVERCTAGAGDDDDNHRHVHEILFLVSNSPGAITFLSRRITSRLESPRAAAAVAIRSLLLVHRLLRAGDRYFEQDLRSLWSSRDLRLDSLLCSCSPLSFSSASGVAVATGACAFVHGYSAYLEERMLWGLEYPLVRVVTPAMASAVMEMDPTMPIQEEEEEEPPETEAESSGGGGGGLTFASKMETTISTVWVEFEEDDKLMLSGGDAKRS
nr:unnamed protein product [Digitaria exilis]